MAEGEEVSNSVKIMAEKHVVIRSHLNAAEADLAKKKRILANEEEKVRLKKGEICLAWEKFQFLNEKLVHLKESVSKEEEREQGLLKEFVDTEWKVEKVKQDIEKVKKIYANQLEMQETHKSAIKAIEGTSDDSEIQKLKKEVDHLLSLKKRLEDGDPDLKRIWTGEALQTIAEQTTAILDAFAERDLETEVLQAELDEKLEQVKQAEQTLHIEEKQNQARLRLMQKQLNDLEATEKHLRSTVEYMEQQVSGTVAPNKK